jgi:hypothetical protein
MRNAKLFVLALVCLVSGVGCTIQTQSGVKAVPYDYSDYAYYDRAFGAAPTYEEVAAEQEAATARAEIVRPAVQSTPSAADAGAPAPAAHPTVGGAANPEHAIPTSVGVPRGLFGDARNASTLR